MCPEFLQPQGLPDSVLDEKNLWEGRCRSIVESEEHLYRNGTRIIKLFLHLSKEEQRKRLIARIDDADKNWKFSEADIVQRQAWDEYKTAYEACPGQTSTSEEPWYVVPADDRKNARLIGSQIIPDTLSGLNLHYPPTSEARRKELLAVRRVLKREKV